MIFFFASSLGKIPALLLEAGSVYAITKFNWLSKIALMAVALLLMFTLMKKILSATKK
jgi:hypothetical protein